MADVGHPARFQSFKVSKLKAKDEAAKLLAD
jgi:hypothetical protein